MIPNVLTIAGTDPTGGAGIQADLKSFSAMGAYGMSVITAVVAQNTCGVRSFESLEPSFVADQIDAVFDDVRVDAVKIGMIATAGIAEAIADRLIHYEAKIVVLDPVMVAKSGDRLLLPEAIDVLRDRLIPLATLITPNLPEAGVLLDGDDPDTLEEMPEAAAGLLALGCEWALLKGGHLVSEESIDILAGPDGIIELRAPRITTRNTHGTGCTLAAAIAALLPRFPMEESVRQAKAYLGEALAHADRLDVGHGHGPVHHFHTWWPDEAARS
ncbi:MAG TPA: bifunctional hydroxymethylpyrimidine kinase/phosphomethylpyrimidine kinase [Thermomicrobiales bacterium]|nr:bifunctional hydroxymethylpyrimidine kinase/phosphomethylpyrimidine kinase [Thermomicrobiales bacterium]